jgi:glycine cleavage system aminomethyltransferase T
VHKEDITGLNDIRITCVKHWPGAYSPHFEKVIGIAMIFKPYWNISQPFKIKINGETFDGKICDLPFV